MDIRILRYFLTVAREENISNAAKQLHITQPTLSRQLMDLEQELSTTLFIRGNGSKGITLTQEGIILRKRAEEIVNLVEKTETELVSSKENVSGTVYIGSGETSAFEFIAKEIRLIQQEHSGIQFDFFSGNADDVTEKIDSGLIDFGIIAQPSNITKYHSLSLPKKDIWGLLMKKDDALAKKESIISKDLFGVPLISSAQRLTSEAFSQWLQGDYKNLNLVATYTLLYNASLLVKENIGYALCLDNIVDTSDNSSFVFRPLSPKIEVEWHIIWKKYKVFSKASTLFLERLQAKLTPNGV